MVPVFPLMLGCTVFGVGTGGSCPCDLWAIVVLGQQPGPRLLGPEGRPPPFLRFLSQCELSLQALSWVKLHQEPLAQWTSSKPPTNPLFHRPPRGLSF